MNTIIVIDRCVVVKLSPDEAFDTAAQRWADEMPNPTNTRTIS